MIDLLDEGLYQALVRRPELFEAKIKSQKSKFIIVDEIQRLPGLLNYIHQLIERDNYQFVLTGSSARKLRRLSANLLAGRALTYHMHPLTFLELKDDFNLDLVLNWGSLPKVMTSSESLDFCEEFLFSYVQNYIKEEIKEEQIVRKLEPFLRFIDASAQMNGKEINLSKMARDVGVDAMAIQRYYEILVDTLLIFELPPFDFSVRKRQSQRSKYYYFDLGVKRAIERSLESPLLHSTSAYGLAFEHFIIVEIIRLADYFRKRWRFSYLRTKDDLEIDLIIELSGNKKVLIEIKSTEKVDSVELHKYENIMRDLMVSEFWIISREPYYREQGQFKIFPWKTALEKLFDIKK